MVPDTFALAALFIVAILVLALIVGVRFVTARDERRDENLIVAALLGVTVLGAAAILLAAVAGPHPS